MNCIKPMVVRHICVAGQSFNSTTQFVGGQEALSDKQHQESMCLLKNISVLAFIIQYDGVDLMQKMD